MTSLLSIRKMHWLWISFLLAFFFYLALHIHWSDSELWAIGLAKNLFSKEHAAIDYKILFNFLLWSVHQVSFTNLQIIENSRWVFAGLGLLLLFNVWKIAGPMSAFFLAGTTLFISQGFKVRSDLLACLIQFCGVAFFLSLHKKKKFDEDLKPSEAAIAILLNILMLLSTPKAVFGIAVNTSFFMAIYLKNRSPWIMRYLKMSVILPFGFFLALALFKYREFLSALDFFVESFKESPQHPAFYQLQSFRFVFESIIRNFHIFALCILGFYQYRKRKNDDLTMPYLVATICSWIVILIHNDRLPFFILTQMVFPCVLAAIVFKELQSKVLKAVIVSWIVVNVAIFSSTMLNEANNKEQISAQNKIYEYLKSHGDPVYYDATVALPLNNKLYAFPAPQHKGNQEEIISLAKRPDLSLIFFGNRLFYYFQPLYLAMEENFFIQIGPGVFAKSYVVRSDHKVSRAEWKEICTSFRGPPRIYMYEGEQFLEMKNQRSFSCLDKDIKIESPMPFVAFTPFEPIYFEGDRSFSQIFDHRPEY